jgi:hypothetical protein
MARHDIAKLPHYHVRPVYDSEMHVCRNIAGEILYAIDEYDNRGHFLTCNGAWPKKEAQRQTEALRRHTRAWWKRQQKERRQKSLEHIKRSKHECGHCLHSAGLRVIFRGAQCHVCGHRLCGPDGLTIA